MITHEEMYEYINKMVKRLKNETDGLHFIEYVRQQEKKDELLGLYLQRERLLNNRPKTKYQIDIWKQQLKNNQYVTECLVKQLEEELK